MLYKQEITLKNGQTCLLRNAEPEDAAAFIDYFVLAHSETDFLTTYPDESVLELDKEKEILADRKDDDKTIEICAFVRDKLVGSAGFYQIGAREKLKHRADFGISIIKDYWGLGIGKALTLACIDQAKAASYLQLELEVVGDNESAVNLYKSCGFTEYGRNPRGFRTREGKWQTLVLMRYEF